MFLIVSDIYKPGCEAEAGEDGTEQPEIDKWCRSVVGQRPTRPGNKISKLRELEIG